MWVDNCCTNNQRFFITPESYKKQLLYGVRQIFIN